MRPRISKRGSIYPSVRMSDSISDKPPKKAIKAWITINVIYRSFSDASHFRSGLVFSSSTYGHWPHSHGKSLQWIELFGSTALFISPFLSSKFTVPSAMLPSPSVCLSVCLSLSLCLSVSLSVCLSVSLSLMPNKMSVYTTITRLEQHNTGKNRKLDKT